MSDCFANTLRLWLRSCLREKTSRSGYVISTPVTRLTQLLNYGVIPIVNENDTVAVDEIKFGENDTLSSLVSALVGADLLILLSDVDGLHTADPHRIPEAERIPIIAEITPEVQELGGGPGSKLGSGGMATKIQAAHCHFVWCGYGRGTWSP